MSEKVPSAVSRRSALVIGAGALAAGVAACGTDEGAANSSTSAAGSSAAPAPVGGGSGTPESTAGSASAAKSSATAPGQTSAAPESAVEATTLPTAPSSAVPTGEELTALDAIADGGCLVANKVLLYRQGEAVTAFSAICTHQGCELKAQAAQGICPCHGSIFDGKTGTPSTGPATQPLGTIVVNVADGKVYKA